MDDDRLQQFLRSKLRAAGRQLAEAKAAYGDARRAARADLPLDERGQARIVCRRYAERRSVSLDEDDRPSCYDAGHPDCQGCVEDIRDGSIETW